MTVQSDIHKVADYLSQEKRQILFNHFMDAHEAMLMEDDFRVIESIIPVQQGEFTEASMITAMKFARDNPSMTDTDVLRKISQYRKQKGITP